MGNGVCFDAKEGSVDRSSSSSDDPQPALISPEKVSEVKN
jgi:hypothetical protein